MTDYEITYILRPTLEDSDADKRSDAIGKIVTQRGGSVATIEKLGKKRLAYEIADVREGTYVTMRFSSDGATAKELERQLKLHEDVIRALLVRLDKHALELSVQQSAQAAAQAQLAAQAAAAQPAPVSRPDPSTSSG
jgi:small subunit ribosomal protein S6